MFRFTWRKWLRQLFSGPRLSRRQRKMFRPRVEGLEDRWVPNISWSPKTAAFIEGDGSTAALLATFTDSDPSPVGDYSATVNWADGSPVSSAGVMISQTGS